MKKALSLILALVLCLSLCACGGGNSTGNNTEPNTEPNTELSTEQSTTPLSARDQLTELESRLFDALVKMVTDDFYEPSAVRVLEIGDFEERTKWDETSLLFGPDTVVVRLQGENRVGGTLNHYYRVCVTAAENMAETAHQSIKTYSLLGDRNSVLDYKGEVGDYAELSDYYSFEESATDIFNIAHINKALNEYWEEMGF